MAPAMLPPTLVLALSSPLYALAAAAPAAPQSPGCFGAACAALQAEPEALPVNLVQIKARPGSRSRAGSAVAAEARTLGGKRADPFWAGKNGDVLRTGASTFAAPHDVAAGPTWSWYAPKHGVVRATPLIDADSNIYAVSVDSGVYKLDPSGQLLWSFPSASSVPCVPALLDGRVFASTVAGEVFALDAATGQELWRTKVCETAGGDTWSVTATEGTVVVGACKANRNGGNAAVVALSAADGSERWRFRPVEMAYNLLSSVSDGRLVFADSTGHVYALNFTDGTQLWGRMTNHYVEEPGFGTGGAILGPNGVVYVTANTREIRDMLGQTPDKWHGRVAAFRLVDGWRLWEADVPCLANAGPAVGRLGSGGTGALSVVFGCGENPDLPTLAHATSKSKEGRVYAFDAETGESRWSYAPPAWLGGSAAGDTLLPQHICLPDSFSNPTIGGDGTVYIGFMDGKLYSIQETGEIQDGQVQLNVSTFDAKAAFQGSAGIAPGMLAAAPCDGVHVWRSAA